MERIIFHIDVNSAYLSWSALEKLHNGSDVDLRTGFLTLVNRIIWQKPHNCGFFYVKFIKF